MSKVLIFTIAVGGFENLFSACLKSQNLFCERHQYHYLIVNKAPRPLLPAEASWLKVPLLIRSLESGYDLVAFIDADIEIRPTTPDLNIEFSGGFETIFIANGHSGRLNAGFIAARPSRAALDFLHRVLINANDTVPKEDRAAYENGHVIYYAKGDTNIRVLPHNMWNNNSHYDPASYLQHYSSGPLRDYWLRHRAPAIASVVPRFKRYLKKRGIKLKNEVKWPEDISQRLEELLPFYTSSYSAYFTSDGRSVGF